MKTKQYVYEKAKDLKISINERK